LTFNPTFDQRKSDLVYKLFGRTWVYFPSEDLERHFYERDSQFSGEVEIPFLLGLETVYVALLLSKVENVSIEAEYRESKTKFTASV
jgi:hypothetical protein